MVTFEKKKRKIQSDISQLSFSYQLTQLKEIQNFLNPALLAEKFVNLLMIDGKKSKAYQILYQSMFLLENKLIGLTNKQKISYKENILVRNALFQAIENVKPSLEVRKVRIARTVYQVPAIVSKKRQLSLAIRWIISSAKKRKKISNYNFSECLTLELLDALKKQGEARQKRDELHKLAQVNRAYTRYRWW